MLYFLSRSVPGPLQSFELRDWNSGHIFSIGRKRYRCIKTGLITLRAISDRWLNQQILFVYIGLNFSPLRPLKNQTFSLYDLTKRRICLSGASQPLRPRQIPDILFRWADKQTHLSEQNSSVSVQSGLRPIHFDESGPTSGTYVWSCWWTHFSH